MTTTTDFIAELVRAANGIDRVSPFDRKRLLDRGEVIAKALRNLLDGTSSVISNIDDERAFRAAALGSERQTDTVIVRDLLRLATEIRSLRVEHKSRATQRAT